MPLQHASQALDSALLGYRGVPLSRKRIDAVPYASMAARIGSGPRSLIILDSFDGDRLIWVSADHVALVTRGGRIVESAGLPQNLVGTQFLRADPVMDILSVGNSGSAAERLVSLVPPDQYDLPIISHFTPAGDEAIEIVGLRFNTIKFQEHCVCRDIGWRFTNHYWADNRTGFIWKSQQHIHPQLPVVAFDVLKPAAMPHAA